MAGVTEGLSINASLLTPVRQGADPGAHTNVWPIPAQPSCAHTNSNWFCHLFPLFLHSLSQSCSPPPPPFVSFLQCIKSKPRGNHSCRWPWGCELHPRALLMSRNCPAALSASERPLHLFSSPMFQNCQKGPSSEPEPLAPPGAWYPTDQKSYTC